jgi:hypothetical protein
MRVTSCIANIPTPFMIQEVGSYLCSIAEADRVEFRTNSHSDSELLFVLFLDLLFDTKSHITLVIIVVN